ncbi:hypothetical protein HMPREF9595_02576 [Cutibacterium acnes HL005PA2]|nr:hypothetical protein HMPREF9567_00815 [Cutibacterium acnes HL013PA1]EFT30061.1 hypothetical protein HMPREF9595_02576 [Cutibacterium acnes HL005PA2]EGF72727.1 hypothetical protein HMPREF9588_00439 [Cutibacterium acnes HL025PA2]
MVRCATPGKARPSLFSSDLGNLLLGRDIVLITESTDRARSF